jgi:hypothetical protein
VESPSRRRNREPDTGHSRNVACLVVGPERVYHFSGR